MTRKRWWSPLARRVFVGYLGAGIIEGSFRGNVGELEIVGAVETGLCEVSTFCEL